MSEKTRAIDAAVERAASDMDAMRDSRQPRFATNAHSFYMAVSRWIESCEQLQEPKYRLDSRARDKWMSEFWHLEPHWAGVLNSISAMNQNRGWTLIGGRNQVYKYSDILHYNTFVAPDIYGWRPYFGAQSLAYYTSDLGTINEIGREGGERGPLRSLHHTDPTQCHLTGDIERPLRYYPTSSKPQEWSEDDYFRLSSMISIRQEYAGLGYCATSRALELAKLMVAILQHDQEMVGARMPKGLLLLRGVREDQWDTALQAREDDLDGLERRYFGGVFVLASEEEIDAKLVALSNLPANFDRQTFTDLLMAAYALVTGFDPAEFWPIQFGALGRGTETEMQHLKATGKGGMEFVLAFQESLQRELPDSLAFEFEQRDDQGKMLEAQVAQAWADVAATLYAAGYDGLGGRPGIASREQALSLLVDAQIVPEDWTVLEEDSQLNDHETRGYALSLPEVRRAAETFPSEPIIRLTSDSRETVLWRYGSEAIKSRLWRVAKIRQEEGILHQGRDFAITEVDVENALREGCEELGEEFCGLVNAEVESA